VPRGHVQRVVIDIPHGSFTIRNGAATHLGVSGIASRDYDGAREGAWAQKVVDDTSVEIYVNGAEAIVRRKFGKNAQSLAIYHHHHDHAHDLHGAVVDDPATPHTHVHGDSCKHG